MAVSPSIKSCKCLFRLAVWVQRGEGSHGWFPWRHECCGLFSASRREGREGGFSFWVRPENTLGTRDKLNSSPPLLSWTPCAYHAGLQSAHQTGRPSGLCPSRSPEDSGTPETEKSLTYGHTETSAQKPAEQEGGLVRTAKITPCMHTCRGEQRGIHTESWKAVGSA